MRTDIFTCLAFTDVLELVFPNEMFFYFHFEFNIHFYEQHKYKNFWFTLLNVKIFTKSFISTIVCDEKSIRLRFTQLL